MNTALHHSSSIFQQQASYEKKKKETGLRLVRKDQVGTVLTTWQKSTQGLIKASEAIIEEESVIARDLQVIGYHNDKAVYHEWIMTKEEVKRIFGQQVVSQLNLNVAYYFQRSIIG